MFQIYSNVPYYFYNQIKTIKFIFHKYPASISRLQTKEMHLGLLKHRMTKKELMYYSEEQKI